MGAAVAGAAMGAADRAVAARGPSDGEDAPARRARHLLRRRADGVRDLSSPHRTNTHDPRLAHRSPLRSGGPGGRRAGRGLVCRQATFGRGSRVRRCPRTSKGHGGTASAGMAASGTGRGQDPLLFARAVQEGDGGVSDAARGHACVGVEAHACELELGCGEVVQLQHR